MIEFKKGDLVFVIGETFPELEGQIYGDIGIICEIEDWTHHKDIDTWIWVYYPRLKQTLPEVEKDITKDKPKIKYPAPS